MLLGPRTAVHGMRSDAHSIQVELHKYNIKKIKQKFIKYE